MKKLILLTALVIAVSIGHAQTALVSRYSLALDTVTNTATKSLTSQRQGGQGQTVTVTVAHTVLTGTMAGVSRLWGSVDGIKYQRIRSTQLKGAQVDSLVLDANHPNYAWVVDASPFNYYQVQTTGVGTTTFTLFGYIVKH